MDGDCSVGVCEFVRKREENKEKENVREADNVWKEIKGYQARRWLC